MMARYNILFLCTANSCRSQMAEAIINNLEGQWEAHSAGTKPSGFIHPLTLQVLKEIGIHHQGKSKHIDDVKNIQFDLVITVCDFAAEECPIWLGDGKRIHIAFPDPAQISGTDLEIISAFRSVRDEIASKIPGILDNYADNADKSN